MKKWMLTESEKEWLAARKTGDYCRWRGCSALWDDECISMQCLCNRQEIIQDGYIFEAKVAARLAKYAAMQSQQLGCYNCVCTKAGICFNGIEKSCAEIFLQTARLQVEEEMSNDTVKNN